MAVRQRLKESLWRAARHLRSDSKSRPGAAERGPQRPAGQRVANAGDERPQLHGEAECAVREERGKRNEGDTRDAISAAGKRDVGVRSTGQALAEAQDHPWGGEGGAKSDVATKEENAGDKIDWRRGELGRGKSEEDEEEEEEGVVGKKGRDCTWPLFIESAWEPQECFQDIISQSTALQSFWDSNRSQKSGTSGRPTAVDDDSLLMVLAAVLLIRKGVDCITSSPPENERRHSREKDERDMKSVLDESLTDFWKQISRQLWAVFCLFCRDEKILPLRQPSASADDLFEKLLLCLPPPEYAFVSQFRALTARYTSDADLNKLGRGPGPKPPSLARSTLDHPSLGGLILRMPFHKGGTPTFAPNGQSRQLEQFWKVIIRSGNGEMLPSKLCAARIELNLSRSPQDTHNEDRLSRTLHKTLLQISRSAAQRRRTHTLQRLAESVEKSPARDAETDANLLRVPLLRPSECEGTNVRLAAICPGFFGREGCFADEIFAAEFSQENEARLARLSQMIQTMEIGEEAFFVHFEPAYAARPATSSSFRSAESAGRSSGAGALSFVVARIKFVSYTMLYSNASFELLTDREHRATQEPSEERLKGPRNKKERKHLNGLFDPPIYVLEWQPIKGSAAAASAAALQSPGTLCECKGPSISLTHIPLSASLSRASAKSETADEFSSFADLPPHLHFLVAHVPQDTPARLWTFEPLDAGARSNASSRPQSRPGSQSRTESRGGSRSGSRPGTTALGASGRSFNIFGSVSWRHTCDVNKKPPLAGSQALAVNRIKIYEKELQKLSTAALDVLHRNRPYLSLLSHTEDMPRKGPQSPSADSQSESKINDISLMPSIQQLLSDVKADGFPLVCRAGLRAGATPSLMCLLPGLRDIVVGTAQDLIGLGSTNTGLQTAGNFQLRDEQRGPVNLERLYLNDFVMSQFLSLPGSKPLFSKDAIVLGAPSSLHPSAAAHAARASLLLCSSAASKVVEGGAKAPERSALSTPLNLLLLRLKGVFDAINLVCLQALVAPILTPQPLLPSIDQLASLISSKLPETISVKHNHSESIHAALTAALLRLLVYGLMSSTLGSSDELCRDLSTTARQGSLRLQHFPFYASSLSYVGPGRSTAETSVATFASFAGAVINAQLRSAAVNVARLCRLLLVQLGAEANGESAKQFRNVCVEMAMHTMCRLVPSANTCRDAVREVTRDIFERKQLLAAWSGTDTTSALREEYHCGSIASLLVNVDQVKEFWVRCRQKHARTKGINLGDQGRAIAIAFPDDDDQMLIAMRIASLSLGRLISHQGSDAGSIHEALYAHYTETGFFSWGSSLVNAVLQASVAVVPDSWRLQLFHVTSLVDFFIYHLRSQTHAESVQTSPSRNGKLSSAVAWLPGVEAPVFQPLVHLIHAAAFDILQVEQRERTSAGRCSAIGDLISDLVRYFGVARFPASSDRLVTRPEACGRILEALGSTDEAALLWRAPSISPHAAGANHSPDQYCAGAEKGVPLPNEAFNDDAIVSKLSQLKSQLYAGSLLAVCGDNRSGVLGLGLPKVNLHDFSLEEFDDIVKAQNEMLRALQTAPAFSGGTITIPDFALAFSENRRQANGPSERWATPDEREAGLKDLAVGEYHLIGLLGGLAPDALQKPITPYKGSLLPSSPPPSPRFPEEFHGDTALLCLGSNKSGQFGLQDLNAASTDCDQLTGLFGSPMTPELKTAHPLLARFISRIASDLSSAIFPCFKPPPTLCTPSDSNAKTDLWSNVRDSAAFHDFHAPWSLVRPVLCSLEFEGRRVHIEKVAATATSVIIFPSNFSAIFVLGSLTGETSSEHRPKSKATPADGALSARRPPRGLVAKVYHRTDPLLEMLSTFATGPYHFAWASDKRKAINLWGSNECGKISLTTDEVVDAEGSSARPEARSSVAAMEYKIARFYWVDLTEVPAYSLDTFLQKLSTVREGVIPAEFVIFRCTGYAIVQLLSSCPMHVLIDQQTYGAHQEAQSNVQQGSLNTPTATVVPSRASAIFATPRPLPSPERQGEESAEVVSFSQSNAPVSSPDGPTFHPLFVERIDCGYKHTTLTIRTIQAGKTEGGGANVNSAAFTLRYGDCLESTERRTAIPSTDCRLESVAIVAKARRRVCQRPRSCAFVATEPNYFLNRAVKTSALLRAKKSRLQDFLRGRGVSSSTHVCSHLLLQNWTGDLLNLHCESSGPSNLQVLGEQDRSRTFKLHLRDTEDDTSSLLSSKADRLAISCHLPRVNHSRIGRDFVVVPLYNARQTNVASDGCMVDLSVYEGVERLPDPGTWNSYAIARPVMGFVMKKGFERLTAASEVLMHQVVEKGISMLDLTRFEEPLVDAPDMLRASAGHAKKEEKTEGKIDKPQADGRKVASPRHLGEMENGEHMRGGKDRMIDSRELGAPQPAVPWPAAYDETDYAVPNEVYDGPAYYARGAEDLRYDDRSYMPYYAHGYSGEAGVDKVDLESASYAAGEEVEFRHPLCSYPMMEDEGAGADCETSSDFDPDPSYPVETTASPQPSRYEEGPPLPEFSTDLGPLSKTWIPAPESSRNAPDEYQEYKLKHIRSSDAPGLAHNFSMWRNNFPISAPSDIDVL